jgi:hypothetical protein
LLSFLSFFLRCRRWWRARQARHHLLHLSKKTRVKKKQIKKKGWCTLTCHKCTSYFLE